MLSLLRIIKFSFQDLTRNIWLTLVTITILLLVLFSMNMLSVVQLISDGTVKAIKEKVDISLYIKADTPETEILALKKDLEGSEKIKNIVYISKQRALDNFRSKYKDNKAVLVALKELGRNPLSPSLTITPANLEQSSLLINELRVVDNPIIESRDFSDNTVILNKINSITKRIKDVGLFIIGIFILISLLVVYNAIRVSIYTHRKEIEIMRLVGASNSFIYMPFVFSALLYTLLSVLIVITTFYPFLTLLQPYLETFFNGYNVNILTYYVNNFWLIFGTQFGIVLFINIIASLFATRRYAKI